MNRKQKIIVSVTGIFLVLLILVGLTYAYFLTQISGNTNEKSISVTTANLSLKYDDGNGILTHDKKLKPNTTVSEKTFSVTNTGDSTINSYAVTFEDLKVTYTTTEDDEVEGDLTYLNRPEDFKLYITCTSSNSKKTCNGYNGDMPSTNEILIKNKIEKDEVQTYTLTLTYIEAGVSQSADMNKTIEAKLDIIDPTGTVDIEGTVTNYSEGDYVQVNSETKISYLNKDGKYKVVGIPQGEHTVSVFNQNNTSKSSTKLNIEKNTSASVNSSEYLVNFTEEQRKIIMNIDGNTNYYYLNEIDFDAEKGTALYYALSGELKIGDYIDYNYDAAEYSTSLVDDDGVIQSFNSNLGGNASIPKNRWRVVNIQNGKVELVGDVTISPLLTMYGANSYLNGPTVLNEMCNTLYSGDYGVARSINVNDLNELTGYDNSKWYKKNGTLTKVPEGVTTLKELETAINLNIKSDYRIAPDGSALSDNLNIDFYTYSTYLRGDLGPINTVFGKNDAETLPSGISISPHLHKLLTFYTLDSTDPHQAYWLASVTEEINFSTTNTDNSYIKYGIYTIKNGYLARAHVWNPKEGAQDSTDKRNMRFLPIITLKDGLKINKGVATPEVNGEGVNSVYYCWSVN